MVPDSDQTVAFIRELTACQNELRAFIYSLLPDDSRVQDVLQDTNELIWRKAEEFAEGTNFLAWACTIARFKVLETRRSMSRDRLFFDDDLVNDLAVEAEAQVESDVDVATLRSRALNDCLDRLTPRQRSLIHDRYQHNASVTSVAKKAGLSVNGLSVTLHRIRHTLLKCIEKRLDEEAEPRTHIP